MALLDNVPPEIIALILDSLLAPLPDIGESCPDAYNKLVSDESWFDFTRCRRGLHSMCRVSRRLSEMARPRLYFTVPLWDEAAMVLFSRTLCRKPEFGLYTRLFACYLTLTNPHVAQKFIDLVSLHLDDFSRLSLHRLLRSLLGHPERFDIPQILLAFVLMSLTMVEKVLLQIPTVEDLEEYDVLSTQIELIKRLFCEEPDNAPFQRIHTLLLQGNPAFEHDDWGAQPNHYGELFASFPNLTRLEVSSDGGIWTPTCGNTQLPFMPKLRHIYLRHSAASPVGLHHLLLNAPMLETLYMASRNDDSPRESTDDTQSKSLNIALANHAEHLQNLGIEWYSLSRFESLVGPGGHLTSLAEL